jgi:hypothetical protein
MMAAYVCGMNFLMQGNYLAALLPLGDVDVAGRLETAARNPPASSEQVLHPLKYWDAARRDPPVEADDEHVERLVAALGYRVIHTNTAGELACTLLSRSAAAPANAMALGFPSHWTTPAAAGWGGDRFYLLVPKGDEAGADVPTKGLWVTVWDSPRDRDEFVDAYYTHTPLESRTWAEVGNLGAVFLYGFGEAEGRRFAERLRHSPPPLRRGGEAWTWWVL